MTRLSGASLMTRLSVQLNCVRKSASNTPKSGSVYFPMYAVLVLAYTESTRRERVVTSNVFVFTVIVVKTFD